MADDSERQDSEGEPLLSFAEATALYHAAVKILQAGDRARLGAVFLDFDHLASPETIVKLHREIQWLRLKIATQMGVDANDDKALDEILASMD